jgi:hypothetical protein
VTGTWSSFLPPCRPVILPLVVLLLLGCDPNTTRPRVVPFPEDASIEVHAKLPAATERLIRALTVDSIPIAVQSTRDGWVETPWLNAETLKPTDARPIGPDVVRIRGWVNPAREGFSTIILEAAYRPVADPSLPGRELERPVPKDHPVQVRLDSMLARIPRGRSATASLVTVHDSTTQKPDSSH